MNKLSGALCLLANLIVVAFSVTIDCTAFASDELPLTVVAGNDPQTIRKVHGLITNNNEQPNAELKKMLSEDPSLINLRGQSHGNLPIEKDFKHSNIGAAGILLDAGAAVTDKVLQMLSQNQAFDEFLDKIVIFSYLSYQSETVGLSVLRAVLDANGNGRGVSPTLIDVSKFSFSLIKERIKFYNKSFRG
ncbi:MAG: hypothetical protein HQK53_00545 [Oligoflexia bacterium]|nr:hypothetical protein [Oligoflexia bacterium]